MLDFEIVSRIHEGPRSVVLRARDPEGLAVVLKRPRALRPGARARAALEAEHALLAQFSHPAVVRAEGLVQDGHRPVLVMRDGGRALAELLAERRLELTESLRFALSVAQGLEAVHARGIVHRDVHPGNILIDPRGKAILADLGLAAPVEREVTPGREARLLGQLRYVAPEQTGRTRGWVDERSDLYALGAVLFEMLTGTAPFNSVDPAELVHAHLAKPAPRLREVDPRLPEILDGLVGRLLEKRPADRYQSARGLASDLQRLLEQAETDGDLGGFELAEHDDRASVRLPERLFGREEALAVIDEAIARSGDGGRVLLRIEGAAGAGKSAMVDALARRIREEGRRMLVGAFSRDRANEPLAGFVEILRRLMQEVLTFDEAILAKKRVLMQQVMGDELPLLASWIPEIATLIPEVGSPPQLEPAEASERMVRAIGRLMGELASAEHPAAIVLEEAQHADPASNKLLQRLLTSEDLHYFLLVVTHQPEAARPGQPLAKIFEAAADNRTEQLVSTLDGLTASDTVQWVAEALRAEVSEIEPLGRTLHRQTAGNPLALTRLVPELVAAGHLGYDERARQWRYDLEAIAASDYGDSVVAVLLAKMARLSEQTQSLLQHAACLGRRFDIVVLAEGLGRRRGDVLRSLAPAAEAGIIRGVDELLGRLVTCGTPCEVSERLDAVWLEFTDERFREAAYEAFAPDARARAHLGFGRWMRDNLPEEVLRKRTFEIAAHFEVSRDLIEDCDERRRVAAVLAEAGDRAAAAVAWERAVALYAGAYELLGKRPFEDHYDLAVRIVLESQRILLFVRQLKAPEGLPGAEIVLDKAQEESHRLEALSVHIVTLCRVGRAEEAFGLAAEVARGHGIDLSPDDAEAALAARWADLEAALDGQPVSSLVDRPPMADPTQSALLGVIRASTLAAYICRRHLVAVTSANAALLSARYGNAPMSSLAYADLSVAVIEALGEVEAGIELADVAVAVADKHNANRAGTRVLVAGLSEVYRRPLLEVSKLLQDALRFGHETGESLYLGIGSSFLANFLYIGGLPLDRLHGRVEGLLAEMNRYLGQVGVREAEFTQRAAQIWRGEREYPWDFRLPGDDEAWALTAQKNPEAMGWSRLLQARLAIAYEDLDAAAEHIQHATEWRWRAVAHLNGIELQYVQVALRLLRAAPGDAEILETAVTTLREVVQGRWEVNASHKLSFAEGALAWSRGERWAALEHFERAVHTAETRGFVNDQAFISEVAARCLEAAGLEHAASAFWTEARIGYEAWGATGEVERLDRRQDRDAPAPAERTARTSAGLSSESDAARVDLEAVIRASQALAQSLRKDDLVQRLLSLMAENAGAQRGALVLEQDGVWRLVARHEPTGLEWDERALDRVAADAASAPEGPGVPVGVLNYVVRTGTAVVMTDAQSEGRFGSDPYLALRRVRALLAAPIERRGKTVGVIYLENNLSPGAFDTGRLEVVEVLAAQAAITLEQTRLYDELERKVEARTRDLEAKNQDLQDSLSREQKMKSRLVIVEKMASLGNLVAGVAHELNTPIGAVLSSADTLNRGLDRLQQELQKADVYSGKVERILGVLRDNQSVVADGGERVGEIVRTLRVFARLDEAERQKADLQEGLDSALKLIQHRLGETEIVREFGGLPPVECYAQEVNQVFMALLTNAAQAVAEREGAGRITLRTGHEGEEVWVEVEDDGPGIPTDVQARIFDPGFTTRGVGVGLGLGLSICFSIVERHGGRIDVEGRPGQGARFRVVLPVRPLTS